MRRTGAGVLLLFFLLTRAAVPARAQELEPGLGAVVLQGGMVEKPPRLALVLSGGGARGAAHIGVLRVLDELHVVPDLVVGTSMGSIVGGLYAAGWTPDEIEEFLESVNWNQTFTDRVPRTDRSFRRKQDDRPYLVAAKLRFKGIKPFLPAGVLGGQRLDLMLKALEFSSTDERDFDRLPVPYRAVAADIATGEAIVLGEGSLSTAMRASMSISGVFPPVVIEGRKLVDGGAVANLPIGIAQGLGAERILAVDISSPLSEADEIRSFFSILNQMSGLLTVGNVQADVQRLRKTDVFIRPDLGDITFASFDRARDAVGVGEAAARVQMDALRALAAPPDVWQAFLNRRAAEAPAHATVDAVQMDNGSWVADEVVKRRLEIEPPLPAGDPSITDAVMQLLALDYFGPIGCDFERKEGQGVLHLDIPRKPYGKAALQFGLGLYTDWQQDGRRDSGFELLARHQVLAINRRGAEWENTIRAGTNVDLTSRFYQPLDYGMRYFAEAAVEVSNLNPSIWVDEAPVASYTVTSRGGRLDVGRVFERCCEVRVGPYWYDTEGEVDIGIPALPSFKGLDSGVRGVLRMDTQDSVAFPKVGTLIVAAYAQSSKTLGADADVKQAFLSLDKSFSFGRYTVMASAEAMKNYEPVPNYQRLYRLGGTFRLSGLGEAELLGESGGLISTMAFREITKLAIGPLTTRILAGVTVETGQAYLGDEPVTWDSLRAGGSLFLGSDTPFGPAVIGVGLADRGRRRAYFVIGQRF